MLEFPFPLAMFGSWAANSALFTFGLYIVVVIVLGAVANRMLSKRNFLSEYFLGSRGLGVWAFALTFAATNSSGGSFMGFPSFVYTHGWVVALWISSYMIVALVAIGIMGKRMNHVARLSGAITLPDVLRDRFGAASLGGVATGLIVFFLSFNLVAQFKAGAVILRTLLDDNPVFQTARDGLAAFLDSRGWLPDVNAGYLLCLVSFAITVILYTVWGGFRAVVWTDVLQGFVMVGGVLIMLPLALIAVGGLGRATNDLAAMQPAQHVKLLLEREADDASRTLVLPQGAWLPAEGAPDEPPRFFRLKSPAVLAAGGGGTRVDAIELAPTELQLAKVALHPAASQLTIAVAERAQDPPAPRSNLVYGPGYDRSVSDGAYLPLGLAISFFCMWTFSGAGQPGNMVRLMAFKDTRTLRRSIFTVAIFYSLVYFPLVIIFICARALLPGWEIESDRIMPEMARELTWRIGAPWLAGLLMAAPFAAVMSTIDSFLLLVSSALVRDVYQRSIHPRASEKSIKRLTYLATFAVGVIAMCASIRPPEFLQKVIIFTGTGVSTTLLAPFVCALYWRRANWQGVLAGMLAGLVTHVSSYAIGYHLHGRITPYTPLGFDPFLVGVVVSFAAVGLVTLLTPPPPERLVLKYFHASNSAKPS